MAIGITKFKSPSQIIFKTAKHVEEDPVVRLKDVKRGVTFLHQDTVFMRVDVSGYQSTRKMPPGTAHLISQMLDSAIWVINLQTGRVFILPGETEIEFIKVTMTIEGE